MTSEMTQNTLKQRIQSIDALRGLVILLMLLDHVRERFFYNHPVSDPMVISETEPALFWSRFVAHFCAPIFVFLTGVSAWLYQQKSPESVSGARDFLWRRGLFLVLLEVTLVNFSWFGAYETLYLQVIWIIGLSMLVLSAAVSLPRWLIFVLGLLIVAGHNALDPIQFSRGEWGYTLWTILHDRGNLFEIGSLTVRASYPLLPWIGVIFLGYSAGALYANHRSSQQRYAWLLGLAALCVGSFLLLRGLNIYGETQPWIHSGTVADAVRSLLNVTKYPPSLNFIQVTLAGMFILLYLFERFDGRWLRPLVSFGGAPMFFYLLHLYVLLVLYKISVAIWGTQGEAYLSLPSIAWIWGLTVILAVLLYVPTRTFQRYKRQSQRWWLKYL